MTPLSNFIAAASLAGLVAAAPAKIGTAIPSTHRGTTLHQVRNDNYTFNGAVSVYKTYLKFGAPIPDHLQAAVEATGHAIAKRTSGSAVATPIDISDDAYSIPVSIGTPAQTLSLDLDTGSSDLWVFSSETSASQVNGQTIYTPSKSSTSKAKSGYTWKVSYGDGSSSSGDIYTDKVTIGGITASSQAVECAKTVSSSFTSDSAIDGLIGMGFDSLNSASPRAVPTFFDNIVGSLDKPVFAANLKHNKAGSYDFGFIDTTAYTGALTYVSVNTNPGYWTFTSSGYGIGSAAFKSTSVTGMRILAYYAKISGSSNSATYGGYVFRCSVTPPDFIFGVGSARITIPGSYMNYGPVSTGSSTCFGGLQDSSDIGINIFGDVALKAAYVVFDGTSGSERLGWASKAL